MKKKITPQDFIIYLMLLSIMIFFLIKATYKMTPLQYKLEPVLLAIVLPMCYLHILKRYKYAWMSIVLFFIVPSPFYSFKHIINLAKGSSEFVRSIIENQSLQEQYYNYFHSLMYIGIIFIVSIFFYLVIEKGMVLLLLIFGTAIFSIYYFLGSDQIYSDCTTFLIIGLMLYAFDNYVNAKNTWKASNHDIRESQFRRLIVIITAFILLVNVSVKILPYAKEPLSFSWFEEKVISRFQNMNGRGDRIFISSYQKNSFNLSYTGYQPREKRLGGPININNDKAFELYSENFIGELHLRGSIKDNYTGEVWTKTDKSPANTGGLIYANGINLPYSIKTIRITPAKLKTTTIFNALYPFSVQNTPQNILIDSDLEIYSTKPITKGQSYVTAFKDYQFTSKVFQDSKVFEDYGSDIIKYMQIPQSLPDRVEGLTKLITKGYDTPYEKASAIEDYLKTNYPYDLKTSNLPENTDFVDNFLFVEKKGSCTYYASAMAVMCRLVDIPSRYVEGFAVRIDKSEESIDVFNSSAHAWVELYFDGLGWVTFDPTPGHESAATDVRIDTNNEDDISTNEENNTNPKQNSNDQQNAPRNLEDYDDPNISNESENDTGFGYTAAVLLTLIFILLLLMLLICCLYNIALINNKKYMNQLLHKLFLYGKNMDVTYREGETIREYFGRLKNQTGIDFEKLTDIYEDNLYANHNVEDNDYKFIINKLNSVKNRVVSKRGKLGFYMIETVITLNIIRRSIKNKIFI
jgi:hypothetical protein